ncbi:hypothetical protein TIFTF001_002501, partial [Ficus carica]
MSCLPLSLQPLSLNLSRINTLHLSHKSLQFHISLISPRRPSISQRASCCFVGHHLLSLPCCCRWTVRNHHKPTSETIVTNQL